MYIRLICLTAILGLSFLFSSANAQDWCVSSEVTTRSGDEEEFNNYVISFEQGGGHLNMDVKIIPVVVHVVYNDANDSTTMNFSRIVETIDRTNIYLRKQNADTVNTHPDFIPVASDTQIELCLASNKPDGSAFNGVVYTPSFNDSQLFDVTKYLNIIVDPDNFGAYASFPWEINGPTLDGVFIGYTYFGYLHPGMDSANEEGKILVHEIGHYLGLYHTFHGGFEHLGDCSVIDDPTIGDRCGDTPLDWSFFPIPGGICDNPFRYCDNGDSIRAQVENYMHYNRDECLNMFSDDQRTRMRACLDGIRSNLVSSENHDFTGVSCNDAVSVTAPEFDKMIHLYPNPTREVFFIENGNKLEIQMVKVYSILGQLVTTMDMNQQPLKIDMSRVNSGIYYVKIETGNQKIVKKIMKQ